MRRRAGGRWQAHGIHDRIEAKEAGARRSCSSTTASVRRLAAGRGAGDRAPAERARSLGTGRAAGLAGTEMALSSEPSAPTPSQVTLTATAGCGDAARRSKTSVTLHGDGARLMSLPARLARSPHASTGAGRCSGTSRSPRAQRRAGTTSVAGPSVAGQPGRARRRERAEPWSTSGSECELALRGRRTGGRRRMGAGGDGRPVGGGSFERALSGLPPSSSPGRSSLAPGET